MNANGASVWSRDEAAYTPGCFNEQKQKMAETGGPCGSALCLERRKAGGVGVPLGQFQEDDDSRLRAECKCSGAL